MARELLGRAGAAEHIDWPVLVRAGRPGLEVPEGYGGTAAGILLEEVGRAVARTAYPSVASAGIGALTLLEPNTHRDAVLRETVTGIAIPIAVLRGNMVPAAGGETACAGTGGIVPTFRLTQTTEGTNYPEPPISSPTLRWRPHCSFPRVLRTGPCRSLSYRPVRPGCGSTTERWWTRPGRWAGSPHARSLWLRTRSDHSWPAATVARVRSTTGPRWRRPATVWESVRQCWTRRSNTPESVRSSAGRSDPSSGQTRLRRYVRGTHHRAQAGVRSPVGTGGRFAGIVPGRLGGQGLRRRGSRAGTRDRADRRPRGALSRGCPIRRNAGRYQPRI